MRLEFYANALQEAGLLKEANILEGDASRQVASLSFNSNDEQKDGLFVCKGAHFKPEYLESALHGGAFCYLSETPYETAEPCSRLIVTELRPALSLVTLLFFGPLSSRLHLTGFVGTKGKTSSCYFLRSILDDYLQENGQPKSAFTSSIWTYDGKVDAEASLTTPDIIPLYRNFKHAVESKVEYFSMEVSSQALKYGRVDGVQFEVSCFLNVSEDHISPIEHPDFEDYIQSKMLVFKQSRQACVCLSSDHLDRILAKAREDCPAVYTFGLSPEADVYGYEIRKEGMETCFRVRTKDFDEAFRLCLPGIFNVENALAAISAAWLMKIPVRSMQRGLYAARVPGRMEFFTDENTGAIVLVDYVHTRIAYERLLSSLREEFPDKKLEVLMGCNDKALNRRRDHAEVISKYCTKCYVTDEDPGYEDRLHICQDIASHLERCGCPYEVIPDRSEAIRTAMAQADADTILICGGKGREAWQKINGKFVPHPSDVELVEKYAKKRNEDVE